MAAGTGVSVGVGGRVAVGNDVDTSFATGVATGGAVAVGTRVGIVTGGKVAARVAVGSGAGTGVVVQACSKMVRAPADRPKAAAVRRKSRLLICVIGWLPVFFSLAGFILTNAGPPHSFLDSLPE